MAAIDNLQTAYNNVSASLAAITADPKPTYLIDGQSVKWQELFDSYMNQLEKIEAAIARAGGPFELSSDAI